MTAHRNTKNVCLEREVMPLHFSHWCANKLMGRGLNCCRGLMYLHTHIKYSIDVMYIDVSLIHKYMYINIWHLHHFPSDNIYDNRYKPVKCWLNISVHIVKYPQLSSFEYNCATSEVHAAESIVGALYDYSVHVFISLKTKFSHIDYALIVSTPISRPWHMNCLLLTHAWIYLKYKVHYQFKSTTIVNGTEHCTVNH